MTAARTVKPGPLGLADEALLLSTHIGHKIVVRVGRPPTEDPDDPRVSAAGGTLVSFDTNSTTQGGDNRITLYFEGGAKLHLHRGDAWRLI